MLTFEINFFDAIYIQKTLTTKMLYEYRPRTLVKWVLEFLRIRAVNFHGKFGLGIPNYNNSGSKNQEIPRNS